MATLTLSDHRKSKGAVLIVSMIFVLVFSALAVSMAALSGTNVQVADNQCKLDRARSCAESGFDVIRFWLNKVSISGTTSESQRLTAIANAFQNELTTAGITNITISYDGTTITIPSVPLDSNNGCSFSATICALDVDTLQIDVTGAHDSLTRTIRSHYCFTERAHTVFDFGVATKGPLSLTGNIELEGINVNVEASVYIESENSNLALSIIGNSKIAGDVSIVNPIANVDLQGGQAGIGGETGQDAIDNHVDFGVPPSEFPEPVPSQYLFYATNIVDANTDTSSDAILENVLIIAGTNPNFTGHVTLKGIVYIETPNVVTFTGSADVIAMIIGDGSWTDNTGTNQINFLGNVTSLPVSDLPNEEQFEGLHDETGTFVMAPGFRTSFGGSFDTLSGAIASNGVEFFGNAGGTINGSVINYSDDQMDLSGNSDLYFNRSGLTEAPAGFVPEIILDYDPSSYNEVVL
ncbi:MAG: pilus assembly PilX N-terminal domain-containing protein [Sedimentisphaerales bacterium]|nr:pilus assembly PilX N-terminal domain-containing protein [Sedimentisphaerales bacterium]